MIDRSVTIRQAVTDDARVIAEVHVAAWRTTYPGIIAQSYIDGLSVEERAKAWDGRIRNAAAARSDILVAEGKSGIVGFLSGGPARESEVGFDAELRAIYLRHDWQRAGIGRQLAGAWAASALQRGFSTAVVCVLAQNSACTFYERLGARQIRDSVVTIGDVVYPERWYGWDDLRSLAA